MLLLCLQVRRPLPLSVLLSVLLDAHILGIEMPQERLIRTTLADYEGWQVRHTPCPVSRLPMYAHCYR